MLLCGHIIQIQLHGLATIWRRNSEHDLPDECNERNRSSIVRSARSTNTMAPAMTATMTVSKEDDDQEAAGLRGVLT